MAFFSVIIPSYNRSGMAADAVNSVLSQTFRDFEIIVVDDGSTDDTEEALRCFSDRITYHKQKNSGVASARNKGISLSSGSYICYLDSDDLWHPEKLAVYKKAIDTTPNIAFLFSDFHKHDIKLPEPYTLSNSDMFPYIYDLSKNQEGKLFTVEGENLLRLLFKGYPLYPSTFAVRRDVHDHFRWDPGILKSEDFNFTLKVSRKYGFAYLSQSLTTVRVHDSNKSADFLTKNNVNLFSMKLYRDLYVKEDIRPLCNFYISQKQFGMGKSYLRHGLLKLGVAHIFQSLLYKENWKRLVKRVFTKPSGEKRAA
ncbi:glycosyltransferase involved in cell wall biosynthesis [Marinobacter sp. LV10R520-4]|uniref:glycosyltransferase family 2 protein n=1 Tax=Marinobacter sp. LV10R520-4 TaxID=1761796 RepID=UPI000BF642A8|nr:glycosyltransferase family 2 protein [Marinobacter sp. LV10R520-4]PFG54820.1 glycosyltransferase involved in cell wall biosynthesis [Marinobacter sp. LV10R520-4]